MLLPFYQQRKNMYWLQSQRHGCVDHLPFHGCHCHLNKLFSVLGKNWHTHVHTKLKRTNFSFCHLHPLNKLCCVCSLFRSNRTVYFNKASCATNSIWNVNSIYGKNMLFLFYFFFGKSDKTSAWFCCFESIVSHTHRTAIQRNIIEMLWWKQQHGRNDDNTNEWTHTHTHSMYT